jgi:copper(I)-binding protein
VKDAWVRGTVAQQKATGAFMTLTASSDLRLVKAESTAAGAVEVHEMAMDGDVMRMRAVPALELPAGKAIELKPGGYHVMLLALKKPLQAGDTVAVTLTLEGKDKKRETVEIQAPVRAMNAAPAMDHKQGMDHKH